MAQDITKEEIKQIDEELMNPSEEENKKLMETLDSIEVPVENPQSMESSVPYAFSGDLNLPLAKKSTKAFEYAVHNAANNAEAFDRQSMAKIMAESYQSGMTQMDIYGQEGVDGISKDIEETHKSNETNALLKLASENIELAKTNLSLQQDITSRTQQVLAKIKGMDTDEANMRALDANLDIVSGLLSKGYKEKLGEEQLELDRLDRQRKESEMFLTSKEDVYIEQEKSMTDTQAKIAEGGKIALETGLAVMNPIPFESIKALAGGMIGEDTVKELHNLYMTDSAAFAKRFNEVEGRLKLQLGTHMFQQRAYLKSFYDMVRTGSTESSFLGIPMDLTTANVLTLGLDLLPVVGDIAMRGINKGIGARRLLETERVATAGLEEEAIARRTAKELGVNKESLSAKQVELLPEDLKNTVIAANKKATKTEQQIATSLQVPEDVARSVVAQQDVISSSTKVMRDRGHIGFIYDSTKEVTPSGFPVKEVIGEARTLDVDGVKFNVVKGFTSEEAALRQAKYLLPEGTSYSIIKDQAKSMEIAKLLDPSRTLKSIMNVGTDVVKGKVSQVKDAVDKVYSSLNKIEFGPVQLELIGGKTRPMDVKDLKRSVNKLSEVISSVQQELKGSGLSTLRYFKDTATKLDEIGHKIKVLPEDINTVRASLDNMKSTIASTERSIKRIEEGLNNKYFIAVDRTMVSSAGDAAHVLEASSAPGFVSKFGTLSHVGGDKMAAELLELSNISYRKQLELQDIISLPKLTKGEQDILHGALNAIKATEDWNAIKALPGINGRIVEHIDALKKTVELRNEAVKLTQYLNLKPKGFNNIDMRVGDWEFKGYGIFGNVESAGVEHVGAMFVPEKNVFLSEISKTVNESGTQVWQGRLNGKELAILDNEMQSFLNDAGYLRLSQPEKVIDDAMGMDFADALLVSKKVYLGGANDTGKDFFAVSDLKIRETDALLPSKEMSTSWYARQQIKSEGPRSGQLTTLHQSTLASSNSKARVELFNEGISSGVESYKELKNLKKQVEELGSRKATPEIMNKIDELEEQIYDVTNRLDNNDSLSKLMDHYNSYKEIPMTVQSTEQFVEFMVKRGHMSIDSTPQTLWKGEASAQILEGLDATGGLNYKGARSNVPPLNLDLDSSLSVVAREEASYNNIYATTVSSATREISSLGMERFVDTSAESWMKYAHKTGLLSPEYMVKLKGQGYVPDLSKARKAFQENALVKATAQVSKEEVRKLNNFRNAALFQLHSLDDTSLSSAKNVVLKYSDTIEGDTPFTAMGKYITKLLGEARPLATVNKLVSDLVLGCWNPAQLKNGAISAAQVQASRPHLIHAMKHWKTIYSLTDYRVPDEAVEAAFTKLIDKGDPYGELVKNTILLGRHSLFSLTPADIASSTAGVKVSSWGKGFFNTANRIQYNTGLMMALDDIGDPVARWGAKWYTNKAALDVLLPKANDYSLNATRVVGKRLFQDGSPVGELLRLPLNMSSYTLNATGSLLTKWNKKDLAYMGAITLGIMGPAAIPFVGQPLTDAVLKNVPDEHKDLVGRAMNGMVGITMGINLGKNDNLFTLLPNFISNFMNADKSFLDAYGALPLNKVVTLQEAAFSIAKHLASPDLNIKQKIEVLGDDFVEAAARSISTVGKARQAYWLTRYGEIRDSKGNRLVSDSQYKSILKLFGFQTIREVQVYRDKQAVYALKDQEADYYKMQNSTFSKIKSWDGNDPYYLMYNANFGSSDLDHRTKVRVGNTIWKNNGSDATNYIVKQIGEHTTFTNEDIQVDTNKLIQQQSENK